MTIDDANGPLLATLLGSGFLASSSGDHFLEGGPISAAISGSVLAGFKAATVLAQDHPAESKIPRYRWVMPVISGVATGIFCGPFFANIIGWETLGARVFLYFLLGLLGSTLVDMILDNRQIIATWLLRRGAKLPVPQTPDNPAKG